MNINFENEIHSWLEQQDKRTAIPPNTIVIPSSQELFFEAKLTVSINIKVDHLDSLCE